MLCWSCWGCRTVRCRHLVCVFVGSCLPRGELGLSCCGTRGSTWMCPQGLCQGFVLAGPGALLSLRCQACGERCCSGGRGYRRPGAGRQLSASLAGPECLRSRAELLVFPSSFPVPGRDTGMGRADVMGLERKGKERWSRNAQARSSGKCVAAMLQSNREPGACAVVPLLAVVGWWCPSLLPARP